MARLTVNLVTPKQDLLHQEVDQVTAPSVMGEVGLLPEHLPILAQLHEGPLGLFIGSDVHYWTISGGFVEVNRDSVTILAETAERADSIDEKRSQKTLADAEAQVKKLDVNDPEYDDQVARARRAQTRLDVVKLARG